MTADTALERPDHGSKMALIVQGLLRGWRQVSRRQSQKLLNHQPSQLPHGGAMVGGETGWGVSHAPGRNTLGLIATHLREVGLEQTMELHAYDSDLVTTARAARFPQRFRGGRPRDDGGLGARTCRGQLSCP